MNQLIKISTYSFKIIQKFTEITINLYDNNIFIGTIIYEFIDNLKTFIHDTRIKNTIFISRLEILTEHINKGYGTILMNFVLDSIKKYNLPVYINVMPIGKIKSLNYLINYYQQFGFMIINKSKYNCEMIL